MESIINLQFASSLFDIKSNWRVSILMHLNISSSSLWLKMVKVVPHLIKELAPKLIPVSRQSAYRLLSHKLGGRLPLLFPRPIVTCRLQTYLLQPFGQYQIILLCDRDTCVPQVPAWKQNRADIEGSDVPSLTMKDGHSTCVYIYPALP